MSFIEDIKNRAKADRKRIILPESMDKRVLKAAEIATKEKIADITIIGGISEIQELARKENVDLTGIKIFDPFTSPHTEELINAL